jgi:hypothetical protein
VSALNVRKKIARGGKFFFARVRAASAARGARRPARVLVSRPRGAGEGRAKKPGKYSPTSVEFFNSFDGNNW